MAIVIAAPHRDLRFGVSRVASLLAANISRSGEEVLLVWAFKPTRGSVQPSADLIRGLPELVLGGDQLPESDMDWQLSKLLQSHVATRFDKDAAIVSLGWPFLSVGAFMRDRPTILIDAGCVPTANVSDQAWLRRLRAKVMPYFTDVVPVSRFIAESQTLWDQGSGELPEPVGHGGELTAQELAAVGKVLHRPRQERPSMNSTTRRAVVLGRYQEDYKNSQKAVRAFAEAARQLDHLSVEVTVLGQAPSPDVYSGTPNMRIRQLTSVDDEELRALLDAADVAVSTSLWEGFNLPLAEAHWSGTPVYALAQGAHPEVLLPTQLVREDVLAAKLTSALESPAAPGKQVHSDVDWNYNLTRYRDRIAAAAAAGTTVRPEVDCVFINVSNAMLDPANSGVVRTTRKLARALSLRATVVPVVWDDERANYRLLAREEAGHLCEFGGPDAHDLEWGPARGLTMKQLMEDPAGPRAAHFLDVEVRADGRARERARAARATGVHMSGWVMDLIPIERPDLTSTVLAAAFSEFLESRAEFDSLYFLSEYQLRSFDAWCASRDFPSSQKRSVVALPPGVVPHTFDRKPGRMEGSTDPKRVVMVSTIEPRKNHLAAIAAMDLLRSSVDAELRLVGNSYANDGGLGEAVHYLTGTRPWVHVHGIASDDSLERLYASADVCLYPSLIEGYGLPIAEAQAFGVPCVTHNHPSLSELAQRGGCLQVDCTDALQIAEALRLILTDVSRAVALGRAGHSVQQPTWADVARVLYPETADVSDVPVAQERSALPHLPIDLDPPFDATYSGPSHEEGSEAPPAMFQLTVAGDDGPLTLSAQDAEGPIHVESAGEDFFWLRNRLSRLSVEGAIDALHELEVLVTAPPGSAGTWLVGVGSLSSAVYLAPGQEAERGYFYARSGDKLFPQDLWLQSRGATGTAPGDPRQLHARVVPVHARPLQGPLLAGLRSSGTEVHRWYGLSAFTPIPVPTSSQHELVVTSLDSAGQRFELSVGVSNAHDRVRRVLEWSLNGELKRETLWRGRWRRQEQTVVAALEGGEPLVIPMKVTGPVCQNGGVDHVAWLNLRLRPVGFHGEPQS